MVQIRKILKEIQPDKPTSENEREDKATCNVSHLQKSSHFSSKHGTKEKNKNTNANIDMIILEAQKCHASELSFLLEA
ncbi:hypothetical protein POVCU1_005900 [Plasmodium ovale curtisi]|uniref:Uncharacterized protein n=2 Tax=Plasmodium ovale curtisi TaxID=864141 RepID=A0A1A8VS14_PLAOA|nr:hypothetical protein POVCU1_005900 [Plasmodium ovale curtisi]